MNNGPSEKSNPILPGSPEDRMTGALVGLAVGDALGATYEFVRHPELPEKLEMIGGGPFGLAPGEWTDDTSMALCLAESLLACRRFNAVDQMTRYLRWAELGHLSSRPAGHPKRCFDIGVTTSRALKDFCRLGKQEGFCGSQDTDTAGNGSLMRLAPVPLFFRADSRQAVLLASESSRTTHGAREAVDGCAYFAGLLLGAFGGASKDALVGAGAFEPVPGIWGERPLADKVAAIAGGSFRLKPISDLRGSGYVIDTLEAALWAFWSTHSFEEGCRAVIALGEDTDTTAAVFGQIAGAFYGFSGIPERWSRRLARRELILRTAQRLVIEAPA